MPSNANIPSHESTILVYQKLNVSPVVFSISEPFDPSSWMLVALLAIQASAYSIFLFEWLSPSGYNMKVRM